MATFLSILGGLLLINFILLKFSVQSVEGDTKKPQKKIRITKVTPKVSKDLEIAKAA
ncbi:hypothetical protein ACE939_06300 [Aquimarina sp. W85]|uniref:hypothetical protein n=1 Tax=Aquimarina rhodophyticola TaxID=3342246 RepID=UPI00366B3172